jgi:hypothetical protein
MLRDYVMLLALEKKRKLTEDQLLRHPHLQESIFGIVAKSGVEAV